MAISTRRALDRRDSGPDENHTAFVSVQCCAFSGSTLLAFLLGSHHQIATVGEMDGLIPGENPERYLCSCGEPIQACEFWHSVRAAMQARGYDFDTVRFDTKLLLKGPRVLHYLRYGSTRHHGLDVLRDAVLYALPSERRAARALVARNVALVNSVLGVTGKTVFLDTSKDRLKLEPLRRFSGLDLRVIHLVRDVRGVVASALRHGVATDVRTAARNWSKGNDRLRATLQRFPDNRVAVLRYEDLCKDVELTMDRLCRFCGVASGSSPADYRSAPHHIIGNAMRLRQEKEVALDERWRRELDRDQLQEIRRVSGTHAQRYGYH